MRPGAGVFDRLFGKSKPPRDINELIHEIADRKRPLDYDELFRRLPALKLYFPVSASAIDNLPRGTPLQVGKDSALRAATAAVNGKTFVLLYASRSDKRLGEHYAEIEGMEALRMVMRIASADGLAIQAEGTAWVAMDKKKIGSALGVLYLVRN